MGDEDAEGEGGSDSGDDVDLAALDLAFQLYDNQLTLLFISCTSFHLLLPALQPPQSLSPPRRSHRLPPPPLSLGLWVNPYAKLDRWPMGRPIGVRVDP